jgi:quaternary ammonium compound-resistance protein SugE
MAPVSQGLFFGVCLIEGAFMAWMLLVTAGVLEIVWAVALKLTGGFTRFWPSVLGITSALASFLMLAVALKSLPVGTAYAVWVGIGAFGVAAVGILALGESASLPRLVCLGLVLGGVIGLRLMEG